MEHWEIVLTSIMGFIAICSAVFYIPTVRHYTKKEDDIRLNKMIHDFHKVLDEKLGEKQDIKSCTLFHQQQDIRNVSFTNTMVEIKDEVKEIKHQIQNAIEKLLSKKEA